MTMPTPTMQRAHDEAMGGDEPTLPPKPRRRSFSAGYKLAILEAYDACEGDGDKGALLRREGLYSSHVIEWTRARDAGALTGGAADPAAPVKRPKKTAEQIELEKLRRRNAQLEADLTKTRLALDIMGKAHALLESLSERADSDEQRKKR